MIIQYVFFIKFVNNIKKFLKDERKVKAIALQPYRSKVIGLKSQNP